MGISDFRLPGQFSTSAFLPGSYDFPPSVVFTRRFLQFHYLGSGCASASCEHCAEANQENQVKTGGTGQICLIYHFCLMSGPGLRYFLCDFFLSLRSQRPLFQISLADFFLLCSNFMMPRCPIFCLRTDVRIW